MDKLTRFELNMLYVLVDPAGLRKEIGYRSMADFIVSTGSTIKAIEIDEEGSIKTIGYGNGCVDPTDHIDKQVAKYFRPIEPCVLEALLPVVKPIPHFSDENVIKFPKPNPMHGSKDLNWIIQQRPVQIAA